jgi:SAM-dependent MidA family methyltransferase
MPRSILPDPPSELKPLSNALVARLEEEIRAAGCVPFSRFMERALYEPGLGYYSAGLHKLGASGDFVTAPELGRVFSACLARQVGEVAERLGAYRVLEVGAGSGRLAVGLLQALPPDLLPERYLVLETSADLRKVQRELIARQAPGLIDRVTWLDHPPLEPWRGVLIANEVLDALPAERFRIGEAAVEQLCVTVSEGSFAWTMRPAPEELESAVRQVERGLEQPFAPGFRSEIRPRLPAWIDAVCSSLDCGLALFIDYGYPRREYYQPERWDGTLMCHYRHRAHDDPFFWPGLQDITAWVDFTALAEAADAVRLEVLGYASQAMFLLGCGMDRILGDHWQGNPAADLPLTDEARQLTLPGMMGERFQVMGLGRGLESTLCGFSLQDLRYRL